ncbi:precorrin-6y C5,15-methyltransferase (decarboxylating) subunit CbiE [Ferrimonas aestuarii]|uniref:Precorrin-6y C5,15-methyltransferase (Decarboxylating) subunit CbiE n=1 Tax=Ferrimonas aestuarii TaxID=2569539 RepID=A0A4U1BFK1_9GAMM|nr:precorrin-6y C5,15-methyltransferase (decarboxylating) subunit CbiE [Ferrimonas aestuarii]TKB50056.1 precorrin-6y C5,15-methyltransferase (decarboxylating) subunit CbiE [Ferrimonas aestuarii]
MSGQLFLVGMAADGCVSLTSRAINSVVQSEVLVGSESQLAFFPQFDGIRIPYQFPINEFIAELLAQYADHDITILTSGDPLFFGLGQTLAQLSYPHQLEVIPHLSCVQQACARLGLPHQEMAMLSLHGQVNKARLPGLIARIQDCVQFALLTDRTDNPVAVAQKLVRYGELGWQLCLCEALGSSEERVTHWTPEQLAETNLDDINPMNLLIGVRQTQRPWQGCKGHQPDEAYAKRSPKKGLITKAPVRALATANLGLTPTSVVWDVGAGSGSVGIEAAKQAFKGQSYAIECNPECWPMIEANAIAHKVDNLRLIQAKAPEGLEQLANPDAIFCGGSRGQMPELLPLMWQRLNEGGRLVVSAVTLDTLAELHQLSQQLNLTPRILLLSAASERRIGSYTGYQGDNPIHLFIFDKAESAC